MRFSKNTTSQAGWKDFKTRKMKNNYVYSITITHYNNPELLSRMLRSIPERDDIQVIVVDDASSDDNKKKLAALQHRNLEIIYTPENHGAGYERNVGLDHAQGKWLIACDCDDCFADGAFEVLDKYKDTEYDFIQYLVSPTSESLIKASALHSDVSVRKYIQKQSKKNIRLLKFYNNDCWNKMVSMKFMKEHSIRWEECRINVDVMYALQLNVYARSILIVPKVLYLYIGATDGITRKKRSIEREFGFYLAAQKRNGFFKKLGWGYPYYRHDILYLPFIIRKRGFVDAVKFFKYFFNHKEEIVQARKTYLRFYKELDKSNIYKGVSLINE